MDRDRIRVAEPCHADWSAMSGDDRKRFCGACKKHVHDLSAMTEPEAEALVEETPDVCVRYTVAADGRVIHAPTRTGRLVAVAMALFGATPAFASGAVAQPPSTEPGLAERMLRWAGVIPEAEPAAEAPPVVLGQAVAPVAEPVVEVKGKIALPPPEPPPPEPPVVTMGRPVPTTIRLPRPVVPPPVVPLPEVPSPEIPLPAPGTSVIPEVEEAIREQTR